MRIHTELRFLLGFTLSCAAFSGVSARAQTKPEAQREYEQLIYSVKGQDLYRAHCAACHGLDGKGDGPVASTLKAKPADLTALVKNSDERFPEARVRRIITGDSATTMSHGTREMPVWGPIFHQIEADQDFGNVRLQNLMKYLESIQHK